jgi:hypothetical protein
MCPLVRVGIRCRARDAQIASFMGAASYLWRGFSPLFFFIIEGKGRRFDDDGGMWLPDDDTALAQAKMLIQVIKGDSELDYSGWLVIVQDASGRSVGVVSFRPFVIS